MTHLASLKTALSSETDYFCIQVLDKIRFHFMSLIFNQFHHFDDFNPTYDRVGTGDCWHDVSCHVLNLIERLLLNVETVHSEVGCTRNKVNDVVVIFLKSNH